MQSKSNKKSASKLAPAGTAVLFEKTQYAGESLVVTPENGVIDFANPSSEYFQYNDKFHSIQVGDLAKAYLWPHGGQEGKYQEVLEDDEDISDLGGLSVIQVASTNTNGIYVRFENNIPNSGTDVPYSLTIKVSEDIGSTIIQEGGEEYFLVGIIGDENVEHVAQISVRGSSGEYIANGSCYFRYDNGDVSCDEHDAFPTNMSETEGENGFFTFSVSSES